VALTTLQEAARELVQSGDADTYRSLRFPLHSRRRRAILKNLKRYARLVRTPAHLTTAAAHIHRAFDTVTKIGTSPTPGDAAQAVGHRHLHRRLADHHPDSLDRCRRLGPSAAHRGHGRSTNPRPEGAAERQGAAGLGPDLLNMPPGRERAAICKRFGFDRPPATL
jgi:hypothetical protein